MDDFGTQMKSKAHMEYEKNKAWHRYNSARINLETNLMVLSEKKEDELTKSDLLHVIQLNCDFMFAWNSYNYWKKELEAYKEATK